MLLECTGLTEYELSISWAYWTHLVWNVHSKSRASGRNQSAIHAQISATCVVFICWLRWKLTSSFPAWKALEVTAIPEPGSQAKIKPLKKQKGEKRNNGILPLSCFCSAISWLILLFWFCCHALLQPSICLPFHSRTTAASESQTEQCTVRNACDVQWG